MVRDELSALSAFGRGGGAERTRAAKQLGVSPWFLAMRFARAPLGASPRPELENSICGNPSRREQPPAMSELFRDAPGSERFGRRRCSKTSGWTRPGPTAAEDRIESLVGRPAGHNPSRRKLARMAS